MLRDSFASCRRVAITSFMHENWAHAVLTLCFDAAWYNSTPRCISLTELNLITADYKSIHADKEDAGTYEKVSRCTNTVVIIWSTRVWAAVVVKAMRLIFLNTLRIPDNPPGKF